MTLPAAISGQPATAVSRKIDHVLPGRSALAASALGPGGPVVAPARFSEAQRHDSTESNEDQQDQDQDGLRVIAHVPSSWPFQTFPTSGGMRCVES